MWDSPIVPKTPVMLAPRGPGGQGPGLSRYTIVPVFSWSLACHRELIFYRMRSAQLRPALTVCLAGGLQHGTVLETFCHLG